MCGRYYRQSDKQTIAEHFAAEVYDFELADSYNIAPQSTQPIVRLNRDNGQREVALMRWGLIPFWAKDAKIGYSNINAKSETIATSALYREAFPAPPLPGAGLRLLRVEEAGCEAPAAVCDPAERLSVRRLCRHLGDLARQDHPRAARDL